MRKWNSRSGVPLFGAAFPTVVLGRSSAPHLLNFTW